MPSKTKFDFDFSKHKLTTGQKRMLKLADMTETLDPKHFRMDCILAEKGAMVDDKPYRGCGTIGCVMGHAAHNKLFRQLRVHWVKEEHHSDKLSLNGECVDFSYCGREVQEFFDIGSCAFSDLFGGQATATPKQKAKQIREYVRDQVLARNRQKVNLAYMEMVI